MAKLWLFKGCTYLICKADLHGVWLVRSRLLPEATIILLPDLHLTSKTMRRSPTITKHKLRSPKTCTLVKSLRPNKEWICLSTTFHLSSGHQTQAIGLCTPLCRTRDRYLRSHRVWDQAEPSSLLTILATLWLKKEKKVFSLKQTSNREEVQVWWGSYPGTITS